MLKLPVATGGSNMAPAVPFQEFDDLADLQLARTPIARPNVRDQRRRALGAPLAEQNLWELLAIPASGVTTSDDRCIA
jgi:hypothetical protein